MSKILWTWLFQVVAHFLEIRIHPATGTISLIQRLDGTDVRAFGYYGQITEYLAEEMKSVSAMTVSFPRV